ncbi:MAG: stage III sporulation protein AF [Defluviitaleaceae bacterium]|nr:stage III sporulation protein AF [Defluviitaleaceae bacterium]
MEFFLYFRHITYYLMFATIAGMIAPAGKYRKMVSLVLGLVLVFLLVQPLATLFSGRDVPVTQWFNAAQLDGAGANFQRTGDINGISGDVFYAAWWDEYFADAFEAQLNAQVSRLLAANNFSLGTAEFEYSDCFGTLTSVRITASRAENPHGRVPFIQIKPPQISPIQIGSGDGQNTAPETCPDVSAVKTLISQFYNLPETHIHVEIY